MAVAATIPIENYAFKMLGVSISRGVPCLGAEWEVETDFQFGDQCF